jgi:hypothetical protein
MNMCFLAALGRMHAATVLLLLLVLLADTHASPSSLSLVSCMARPCFEVSVVHHAHRCRLRTC